jgi:hypothetical protein
MQKILKCFIGFLTIALLFSCNQYSKQTNTINNITGQSAKLEILYFHRTMRCAACNAVENNTIKVLKESFSSQIENGTIKFVSYNIEQEANKEWVEKYKISFSALLLIRKDSCNEFKSDFTEKAFQCALAKPLKYAEILKAEINKNLNME